MTNETKNKLMTTITIVCPYCKVKQKHKIEVEKFWSEATIITCDVEDVKGCDKDFILNRAEVKATLRKIV